MKGTKPLPTITLFYHDHPLCTAVFLHIPSYLCPACHLRSTAKWVAFKVVSP